MQDSDEEEDEYELESQISKQDRGNLGRVECVLELSKGQLACRDALRQGQNYAGEALPAADGLFASQGGIVGDRVPRNRLSPARPTPEPLTPSTRPRSLERSESPDPLQDTPTTGYRLQRPVASSQPQRSPSYLRSSQEEIQLRAFALPSQILGESTPSRYELATNGNQNDVTASAILGEFGVAALSDDELNPGQRSDEDSNLSDYPSDLSDAEPPQTILYVTPHRRTAVHVVIPSSTALQQQLAAEEARQRNFRQRKPIQLHPYMLEGERYRREVQSRGLRPVPRERSPLRRQGPTNAESQEEEFNPFRADSSSPPEPEIFVSTPAAQRTRKEVYRTDSSKRSRLSPSRRSSPSNQLRVPKALKRIRLDNPASRALVTPARTSQNSPVPQDIWSIPPDSPPYSSSPPKNAHGSKTLLSGNADSLPTPSNSSTFHDDPLQLPESDSDLVPQSVPRLGSELRRPTRVVLSDRASSDSEEAGSDADQDDAQLHQVGRKIKGVLPASWLRIDRQAQERRQAQARQRARQHATQSPEPTEPQRGVAQKIVRPSVRHTGAAKLRAYPEDTVIISDDSDTELGPTAHRQNNVQESVDEASALAAIFDDRYADPEENLANMEHDQLQLPTLRSLGQKRKRQPKITDAFDSNKRTKPMVESVRTSRPQKLAHSASRKKHARSNKVRKTPPPALSVMDIELPSRIPQFLKLARRAAQRDVNQARQSPRRKQIHLHTEQDTADATATLRQWQKGLLKPADRSAVSRSRTSHLLTADKTEVSQRVLPTVASSRAINAHPVVVCTASPPRKRVVPALQLLQRSVTAPSKLARSGNILKISKHYQQQVRRAPATPRLAQLEDDEKRLGLNYRKIAFQKGLQHVQQQLDTHQASHEHFLNPQLARFLADDDALIPPLPTAQDIDEVENPRPEIAQPTNTVITFKKRLRQKPQAKRLDIDARQYRQPSEPAFQPVSESLSVAQVASSSKATEVKRDGGVLLGLGPSGTRYPTTFDITPVKSDTYFHTSTLVGSEVLQRALSVGKPGSRNMDEPAGYCTISHHQWTIRCGPWTDGTYSQLCEVFTSIISPLDACSARESNQTSLVTALTSMSEVLRALIVYFTRHLSFPDPIDRCSFTAKMQQLLRTIFDRVTAAQTFEHRSHVVSEQTVKASQITSYMLVLSTQLRQIAPHNDNIVVKVLGTTKAIAQWLVKHVVKGIKDLFIFHEKNRLHKERENGIQGHDDLVESVVICMHALEAVNEPLLGFWDLVSQELSSSLLTADQIQAFEHVWATVFALLPFSEFDQSGIPDRHRLKSLGKDNWSCLGNAMRRVLCCYEATSRQSGSSVNEYVRANLTRCYVLINDWYWKRPDTILNVIFDFFGKHGLRSLRHETTAGSAEFLQNIAAPDSLALTYNESSFHIALKCLATGLQSMTDAYPDKKIRSFVFRRIPNHGRTYPKDQPLEEESLAALRNHHDLLSTLYCAAPPSCRPKLDHIRELVSHETSHREACRVSVRAWANLATFQLSTQEPYAAANPFALWFKEMLHCTLRQYRLAKTEADEYLESGALHEPNDVVAALIKQTTERNQLQVIATLRDIITGMRRAILSANDQAGLAAFLIDSDIVHLLELPHLDDHRLLMVIRDTLSVLRHYASMQRRQTEQQVSQPKSEESQDYGDFPDLDDLDDLDDEYGMQSVQTIAAAQPSRLEFIQGPLWHLMSNAFGADHLSDDNLLMDCIDTWVLIGGDQVANGGKQWSHYIDTFSQMSWQQLRHTEQTRKFGPYFLAALIAYDSSVYKEYQHEMLTALLLSLADRESMLRFQHQLLAAIVRTDEDHPLLRNLPFFRNAHDGQFDVTADSLRSRRLALISSLLSNMREHAHATSIQEPGRLPEVKRVYATMLKEFMLRLKSNYQQLQQGNTVTGAYVEFVQKIVQFLKQYTGDICPVLPFFTDSVAFPLPSMDPTYVVGRLCGYAPKAKDPRTAKELSSFVQTVAQQAAADDQQAYLINQLSTALCIGEVPATDRVALQSVLLQEIFPAYIEDVFASRISHLIARPIMTCLPTIFDEMIFDLRITQIDSVSATVQSIISIAHAFIRGTEHLKGDVQQLLQSSTLSSLMYMFETATSMCRLLEYIVGRGLSNIGKTKFPLVAYFEEFNAYIVEMIKATAPQQVPSYHGDANATHLNSQSADILAFCRNGLQTSLETNWSDHEGSIYFGQGRAKKEVLYNIGSTENERMKLLQTLRKFQDTLDELYGVRSTEVNVGNDVIV